MSQKDDLAFEPFDHDTDRLDDYDRHFSEKEPEEKLEDVRGESDLSKTKKLKPRGQKALMAFLILVGLVVSAFLLHRIMGSKSESSAKENEVKTSFEVPQQKKNFGEQYIEEDVGVYDPMAAASQPAVTEPEDGEKVDGVAGNIPEPLPIDTGPVSQVTAPPAPPPVVIDEEEEVQPPPKTPEELRRERIFGGFDSIKDGSLGTPSNPSNDNQSSGNGDKQGGGEGNKLATSLTATKLEATAASRMGNRDLTITKGNTIDCVLNTKFDSSVVGMMSCTVTRNIYSASGRVVLIDRGSRVIGEYQGGMKQGDNRVFVMWNRIETPKGVMIDINSPGAGSLGEAGLNGRIDSKFWRRFGGALLVSVINDISRAASESAAEKTIGGDVRLEESASIAQQMATEELERSINIPPSIIKHQGDRLSIYVARDVYFGGVYGLKSKR